ncbi:MAG TPA: hypothetical protein VIU62_04040 [Chloroflexota bacterium]
MAMSAEQTQQTMQAFANAMQGRGDFAQYFNDDVMLTVEGTDQRYQGREAVRQGITGTESLGEIKLRSLFWGEGHAAVEADFIRKDGHHVPYSVIYDLADGKITALRLYFTGPIQA